MKIVGIIIFVIKILNFLLKLKVVWYDKLSNNKTIINMWRSGVSKGKHRMLNYVPTSKGLVKPE